MARTTTKYIRELQITLLDWYRINGRKFPWRNSGLTHYQLIIAETLLQRIKAETVSRFYIQFVKDFPNWTVLAKAKNKEIENYLKPIGLYRQRAKRLKNLAAEMVKRKGNNKDIENPKWIEFPKVNSKTMVEYGCGPAKWVNFSFRFSDSSDILIKTTVKSLKTLSETVYYLETENNEIKIGHRMCSGAFHFDKGNNYEVTFSLIDQSGNFSTQNSKPIRFSQPSVTTQSD